MFMLGKFWFSGDIIQCRDEYNSSIPESNSLSSGFLGTSATFLRLFDPKTCAHEFIV